MAVVKKFVGVEIEVKVAEPISADVILFTGLKGGRPVTLGTEDSVEKWMRKLNVSVGGAFADAMKRISE